MNRFFEPVGTGLALIWAVVFLVFASAIGPAAQESTDLWYEIERINPGLGAPPENVDRNSPRTALRTFLDLAENEGFEAAAHYLNLSELQGDAQATQGPELARKLAGTIDRKLWIYWTTIPSTPDTRASSNSAENTTQQPQRDFLISEVNVESQTYDIRLRRWDNKRVIVPIKEFLSRPFQNWSVVEENVECVVKLLLDPMADVSVLRERFVEIAREDPGLSDHDNLSTYVTGHSSEGLTIEFFAVAPNPAIAWTIEMRFREALVEFVRAEHPQWWPHKRLEM